RRSGELRWGARFVVVLGRDRRGAPQPPVVVHRASLSRTPSGDARSGPGLEARLCMGVILVTPPAERKFLRRSRRLLRLQLEVFDQRAPIVGGTVSGEGHFVAGNVFVGPGEPRVERLFRADD